MANQWNALHASLSPDSDVHSYIQSRPWGATLSLLKGLSCRCKARCAPGSTLQGGKLRVWRVVAI